MTIEDSIHGPFHYTEAKRHRYNPSTTRLEKHTPIICLCGSTRFGEAFSKAQLEFTLQGFIVLSIGCNMRSDAEIFADMSDVELRIVKTRLDELHLRKIDLADSIYVLNMGGYIGESTANEIAYAEKQGKPINYLENPACPPEVMDDISRR